MAATLPPRKDHPTDTPAVRQRHWLYGTNVAILVLVAVVIVSFLAYITSQPGWHYPIDCTSGGIYSLSAATKNLLTDIDTKGKPYELCSLLDGRQAQQVDDLMREYVRNARQIKIYDVSKRDDLETKIRSRYAGETKPYEKAVEDFSKLAESLEKFLKGEAPALGALSQQEGLEEDVQRSFSALQAAYSKLIPEKLAAVRKELRKRTTDSTAPRYAQAVSGIKKSLESVLIPAIEPLADAGKTDQYAKPVGEYVKQVAPRFAKMLASMKAYLKSLDQLAPLKMDEVLDAIDPSSPPSVLIFAPESVKVIALSDIFKARAGGGRENPDLPQSTFEGEQALSSALLGLVRPEKTKIVFVGTSPVRLSGGGQYSGLADRLAKANFETLEWSPAAPQMPGQPPQPGPTPPAEGKGVVWVVLPPDAPNQQQMMMGMPPPDPRPVVEAVRRHLEEGGTALFLAEASSPMMGMMGGPSGGGYAYAELLKPFGVDVKANYTVVRTYAARRGSQTVPQLEFTQFPKHEITAPLQSLRTGFFAGNSEMGVVGGPTIVTPASNKPADAEATVIVRSEDADSFATTRYTGPETKFNAATDMKAPLNLAVAAQKGGGPERQKVVVIGNRLFATDNAIEAQDVVERDGTGYVVPMVPGNAELFMNSVLWLAGYQNMIAVGPRSSVALRIKPIDEGTLLALKLAIPYLGAPIMALVAGGIVYLIRRRA